ncbi:transcriptional regulator [Amycolatopsis sp. NPDC059657]|uniref:transcriptional regulator n=1 Tax=Amycolatopsis sp. NPDC059657 TaxID=3346899 RepID=UPI00366CD978
MAEDNDGRLCGSCSRSKRALLVGAPDVPPEFWETDQFKDAFKARHMGRVVSTYRRHPWHGGTLSQGLVGSWLSLSQTQVSRFESGRPSNDLGRLLQWARVLRIPPDHLWFRLPEPAATADNAKLPFTLSGRRVVAAWDAEAKADERLDDMNRRELLRLLSLAGTLLAAPQLDLDRLSDAHQAGQLGNASLDEYGQLNAHLWRVFSASGSKRLTLPVVRRQLGVLTEAMQKPQNEVVRERLCFLAGDLFQLCGEIFFDCNHYTEAAQCYSLAANACKEARAFDLWACAMTRHAFISVYERDFKLATPLLDRAASLAERGDRSLSTRHWVAAVQAQAYAGLGEFDATELALETARQVDSLSGPVHTSGWLRFEGSRMAQESGTCYVELNQPDLAETALATALSQDLSDRRRGSVLADLAMVGAQRHDADQLVVYADAALTAAQKTGSAGYVGRRLASLRPQLAPFIARRDVRQLDQQIKTLSTASAV